MRSNQMMQWMKAGLTLSCILFIGHGDVAKAQTKRDDNITPRTGNARSNPPGSDNSATADQLYQKAWKLIKDSYFDRTFNGQDWDAWKHKYDGKLTTAADAHRAIKAMIDSLNNRHTKFMDVPSSTNSKFDPKLFGVGLTLRKKDDKEPTVVFETTPNSPAQKAGLHPSDVLVSVNGTPIAGKSLDDTADLLRGPEHSKANITILRKGVSKKFTLERVGYQLSDLMCVRILPGNIGYVRLQGMNSREFTSVLKKELEKIATTSSIILDLRNNSGGLLANTIETSMMFVPKGKVIVTVSDGDGYKTSQVSAKEPIYKGRLFVLVNHDTGAGAEIIAAALQESAGAKVIGQPSAGNATIDAINRLGDGSGIVISIANWLTPNNKNILNKGIQPDTQVVVAPAETATKGPWWQADEPREPGAANSTDVQLVKALSLAKGGR